MKQKIPKPPKKARFIVDRTMEYLQEWKRLFNEIDPGNIVAYAKGDPEFPSEYDMRMDKSRLEGVCDLDVQLYIRIGQVPYLSSSYGSEIYCCPKDDAFADFWIDEDEWIDTTPLVSWKEIYFDIAERKNDFVERIPIPPERTPT